MFHHILVPLDGTVAAEQALPVAARIARRSGAHLTLMRIVPESRVEPVLVGGGEPTRASMEVERQKGRNDLARLSMSPCLRELNVEKKLCVAPLMSEEGRESEEYDLIVLCRKRHHDGQFKVSEHLAHLVARDRAIPILQLHEQESEQQILRSGLNPFRILVILDGSRRAEAAIRPAAMLSTLLSAPEPGSLHLLCIVRPTIVAVDMYREKITRQTHEQAWQTAQAYLDYVTRKVFREIVSNLPLRISVSLCDSRDLSGVLAAVGKEERTAVAPPLSALACTLYDRPNHACWLPGSETEQLLENTPLAILVL